MYIYICFCVCVCVCGLLTDTIEKYYSTGTQVIYSFTECISIYMYYSSFENTVISNLSLCWHWNPVIGSYVPFKQTVFSLVNRQDSTRYQVQDITLLQP